MYDYDLFKVREYLGTGYAVSS